MSVKEDQPEPQGEIPQFSHWDAYTVGYGTPSLLRISDQVLERDFFLVGKYRLKAVDSVAKRLRNLRGAGNSYFTGQGLERLPGEMAEDIKRRKYFIGMYESDQPFVPSRSPSDLPYSDDDVLKQELYALSNSWEMTQKDFIVANPHYIEYFMGDDRNPRNPSKDIAMAESFQNLARFCQGRPRPNSLSLWLRRDHVNPETLKIKFSYFSD